MIAPQQQKRLEELSPVSIAGCCDNPTRFSDALGLLELVASRGAASDATSRGATSHPRLRLL